MKPWRIGSKVPLNVYEGDRPVCQVHSEIDARRIVLAMNCKTPETINRDPHHTPGPWHRAQDMPTMILNHPLVAATEIIAQTSGEANARLICAAPELLEALKVALPCLESVQEYVNSRTKDWPPPVFNEVEIVRSAIATAEGSQSPSQEATTGDDPKA